MKMKHIFSKTWLVTFSFVAAAIGIALACAEGGDIVLYTSNFTPEATVDNEFTPFFYAPYVTFYGISYDTQHTTRFNDDVVNDWYGFLKGKMEKENIDLLLLANDTENDLDDLNNYIEEKITSPAVNKWNSLADLNDQRVRAFIEFTYIARQIDELAVPVKDDYNWNYTSARTSGRGVPRPLLDALAYRYEKASDPFLKNRYWFQNLKALFYANKSNEFEDFFERTKAQEPKNTLYYRGLGYLAAFKYEKANYKQSNILYAEIFDKAPALRTVATNSFYLESEEEWKGNLQMAATEDEKIALWTLLGYFKDEERAISEIYKINPKSKYIDLLLTRLINKKETNSKSSLFKTDQVSGTLVDAQLFKIITRIASESKTSNPYLWHLAAGYINTWEGKYKPAKKHFDQAEKMLPNGKPLAADQLRLLRLVNDLNAIRAIKGNNVEQLISELNWLYNIKDNAPENLRYQCAVRQSKEYLATMYTDNNNILYAELLKPKDGFYTQPSNLDMMLDFLLKNNKSPYEKLLHDIYPKTIYDLYHYKAVVATFEDNLDDAIEYMQKSAHLGETVLLGNPFNGFIKDCHDCEHARRQSVKYTSLSLLLKMKEMKQLAEQNNDAYNNNLLLANAYYNLTFYGNARLFSVSGLTKGKVPCMPEYIVCFAQNMLTNCDLAKKYYLKAAAVAEDDEQRAKVAYLISKCERNEYYNKHYTFGVCNESWEYDYNREGIDAQSISYVRDGFKELKEKYAHTEYYMDVINECEDFVDYVNSK